MTLQSTFAIKVLSESCDNRGLGRVKLIKISSRASNIDMFYIKDLSKLLILAATVSVSKMTICLVKACFSIFVHKSTVFKVKSGITSGV